jgi:hypothetical protein
VTGLPGWNRGLKRANGRWVVANPKPPKKAEPRVCWLCAKPILPDESVTVVCRKRVIRLYHSACAESLEK